MRQLIVDAGLEVHLRLPDAMAFLLAFPSLLREHYRDSTLVRRSLVDLDRGPSEH